IGDVREEVTVTADATALRAETASLGTVVEHEQVVQLPLNGRTFITLASLAPGVALPPSSQLPRINGGRPRTNEYLFDGISVLQPEPGQVAFFPVVDAIQEFKIESNSPPAEFGRFNGGVINLTTRSGANVRHGTAFEFLRNEALNARNFFQSGNPIKPEYRRNQFGGTLGGPVAKDRTFFFVDYQGQRQAIGRTAISTVPTILERQGIFTEAIAGRVPLVYDPATTNGIARTPFPGNAVPLDRIDPVAPLPDGSGIMAATLGAQDTKAWSFASNHQHTFAHNTLNELRVGDTRRTVTRTAARLSESAGAALSIPGIPSNAQFSNTLPTFLIGGYQQLGSPPNTASNFDTSVTEIADALTWLKGRHTLKMRSEEHTSELQS